MRQFIVKISFLFEQRSDWGGAISMIANPLSWFQIQYNLDLCEHGFRNILSIMKDNQHWSLDFGCPPHYFLLVTGIKHDFYSLVMIIWCLSTFQTVIILTIGWRWKCSLYGILDGIDDDDGEINHGGFLHDDDDDDDDGDYSPVLPLGQPERWQWWHDHDNDETNDGNDRSSSSSLKRCWSPQQQGLARSTERPACCASRPAPDKN